MGAALLPLTSPTSPTSQHGPSPKLTTLPKRYIRLLVFLLASASLLVFLRPCAAPKDSYPPYPMTLELAPEGFPTFGEESEPKPPLYERYTEWEESVSQLVSSEDEGMGEGGAKYLFLADHQRYSGWGNAMQEMVLNAYLTWESGRGFVYDNYTWDIDGPVYSDWNGRLRPSRIPLSTMLSGPIIGLPFSPSSNSTPPRSISKTHFHSICPPEEMELLDAEEVRKTLPEEATAGEITRAWVAKLAGMGRCVEVMRDSPQLFDIWLMGSPRVHDVFPAIASSPILSEFKWSPLIHRMFLKNLAYFVSPPPEGWFKHVPTALAYTRNFLSLESSSSPSEEENTYGPTATRAPLPVIALHLRRGDFEEHCTHLAEWGSTYTGYNTLPGLPDTFNVSRYEKGTEAYTSEHGRHCWPGTKDIVRTVRSAVIEWVAARKEEEAQRPWWRRAPNRDLKRVYIMTNGSPLWLAEIKKALLFDASLSPSPAWGNIKWEWEAIISSRDIHVGWEEKHVSQALDMYVGERAEVFVGNGFSSLTANIALLRMGLGRGEGTRFW